MNDREYPDIEFLETDTETIENSMIALFETMYKEMTGKTKKVYPASPERLFIAFMANIVVQQRILINETAKKNVPRYAKGGIPGQSGRTFQGCGAVASVPGHCRFPVLHIRTAGTKRDH